MVLASFMMFVISSVLLVLYVLDSCASCWLSSHFPVFFCWFLCWCHLDVTTHVSLLACLILPFGFFISRASYFSSAFYSRLPAPAFVLVLVLVVVLVLVLVLVVIRFLVL